MVGRVGVCLGALLFAACSPSPGTSAGSGASAGSGTGAELGSGNPQGDASMSSTTSGSGSNESGSTTGPVGIQIPAECGELQGTTGLFPNGEVYSITCSEFLGPAFTTDAAANGALLRPD